MDSIQSILLLAIGLTVGFIGTLIGAGGGFILVPVLLLLFPQLDSEIITSISLAIVFLNATSGSLAYARLKRIDYKTAFFFSVHWRQRLFSLASWFIVTKYKIRGSLLRRPGNTCRSLQCIYVHGFLKMPAVIQLTSPGRIICSTPRLSR